MNIGELAKKTGLSASKIRFYEREGLLNLVKRQTNGYRIYPPEAVVVLNLIVNGQNAGFSLAELRKLLPEDLDNWQHDALVAAIKNKLTDIEELEQKLAQNKQHLKSILSDVETKPDDMDCAAHARQVISRMGLGLPGEEQT